MKIVELENGFAAKSQQLMDSSEEVALNFEDISHLKLETSDGKLFWDIFSNISWELYASVSILATSLGDILCYFICCLKTCQ